MAACGSCPILRSLKRWQAIDNRPQDRCRLSGAAARDSVPDRLDGSAVLQGEAQHHGGVAGCALDVLPGLAAVDKDFAGRAVRIKADGDVNDWFQNRRSKVSRPDVEGGLASFGRLLDFVAPRIPSRTRLAATVQFDLRYSGNRHRSFHRNFPASLNVHAFVRGSRLAIVCREQAQERCRVCRAAGSRVD